MRLNKRETNRTVVNRETRQDLKCSYCPPNRGENAFGKRRPRPDSYKSDRKGKSWAKRAETKSIPGAANPEPGI